MRRLLSLLALAVLFACQAQNDTLTAEPKGSWATPEQLQIENAWVRATPPTAKVAAAYAQIRNTSDLPARLIGGESLFTSSIEVHSMSMQDGMMRMRRLPHLDIPAGETVELIPGGNHFMLFGLSQAMQAGQPVRLTLNFAEDQARTVEFLVKP